MRFDPRVMKKEFVLASLLMASLITYSANIHAQDIPGSHVTGAPKTNIGWNDLRKPRNMSFSQLRKRLKPADEYAALYALQVALSRLGDGQTYVWGRPKRKLRAFITPVNSYRSENGNICRNIIVSLALGAYIKRIKTSACRASDKSWQLQS